MLSQLVWYEVVWAWCLPVQSIWRSSSHNASFQLRHEALTKRQGVQDLNATENALSSLRYGWNVLDLETGLLFPETPKDDDSKSVMIIFCPESYPLSGHRHTEPSLDMFDRVRLTLEEQGILATVPQGDDVTFNSCPMPPCLSFQDCKPFYKCFFTSLGASEPDSDIYIYDLIDQAFHQCYDSSPLNGKLIQCPLYFENIIKPNQYASPRHDTCTSDAYNPTVDNWNNAATDLTLLVFVQGGLADDGIYWPGRYTQLSFSQDLGRQATEYSNLQCSLRQPCDEDITCDEVGSRTVYELGRSIYRSRAAYFILVALENINRQLSNQYSAIGDALTAIGFETWNIDDFFPKSNDGSRILGALKGLGSVLSVLSGFVPVAGPALSSASSILSGVATYLGQSISEKDPLVGPKTFAPIVEAIFADIYPALENATGELFQGNKINGMFDITTMMAHGAWISGTTEVDFNPFILRSPVCENYGA